METDNGMMQNIITDYITDYITELSRLYCAGNATEHTYRFALHRLLESMTSGLTITNEPKRIACGAPDYIITRGVRPLGYIEAKDVGENLNDKKHKEQFDRYKLSLDNLIITDYLTFQLFEAGEPVTSVTIAHVTPNGIEADLSQFKAFDTLSWRFVGYEGLGIETSDQLAKILAAKAKLLADSIDQALEEDKVSAMESSVTGQLQGFREVLIHDISHRDFSDVYAQTIAYGMFAARLNDATNAVFTRRSAAELIPLSNPFLRKLFQYIAGYDLDERIRWGVDDLVDLFNYVDIQAIITEFAKAEHDPTIHFYETFLSEYDPALRKSRGVWFTPQPVVQFIVQAVDHILQQVFGLPHGLADASIVKLKRKVTQKDSTITEEAKEFHRVQILDPATGTGTFLAEVIQNIYQRFKSQQGMWQDYAAKHLIPRVHGFEILMASYAMAHLKLDMLLRQTGYQHTKNNRMRIYLTNSLEESRETNQVLPFAQWLSDEANEANRIKKDVPVMVVMGNPPYNVSSQNKNDWINGLIADYKQELNERNIQPLSDDYIKFIRLGQHFIEKNGEGVLAYISNNSFIDGLIHRQMRKVLLETFDTVHILDLHGNAKKKETTPNGGKDENVFDIQQGVSINIFVKSGHKAKDELAEVFHFDLYGKRAEKFVFLEKTSLQTVKWKKVKLSAPYYFFQPKDFSSKRKYEKGFSVRELFPVNSSGIKTHHDDELVSFSPFTTNSQPYSYRPLDMRFINYDLKKVIRHRYEVMQHFLKGENVGLLTCRQQRVYDFQHVFVSNTVMDICTVSNLPSETTYMFPLYLYHEVVLKNGKERILETRTPNLNAKIINDMAQRLDLKFTDEKESSKKTFAPVDVLDYIYAVLHSPTYRERYKEFLKIDFPRVPYPDDVKKFWKLVKLGGKLRRLHLMEGVEPLPNMANYPVAGTNEVEKPRYAPGSRSGRVYINAEQYFDKVPQEAWEFYIGGYQPAQKWLKDRKGCVLSFDDVQHYQQIIHALQETGETMLEIDEAMG